MTAVWIKAAVDLNRALLTWSAAGDANEIMLDNLLNKIVKLSYAILELKSC